METTDRDAIRYSTDCVQLRGKTGTLAATDGGQCLLQRGFSFPWEDDVLIRRTMVFGSKDLPRDAPVAIGRIDDWAAVRVGPWTIQLRIAKERRFPQVDGVVPAAKGAFASFRLPPSDRKFLGQAISKLPCDDAYHAPVTVELNGAVAVRAKPEGTAPVTELILSGARLSGEPCRFQCNRRFLARALQLGFDSLYVFSPKSPILCEAEKRSYVFAPLDPESAIAPSHDSIRIESGCKKEHVSPPNLRKRRSPRKTMPKANSEKNGHPQSDVVGNTTDKSHATDSADLLALAETVKASARETLAMTTALIAALKQDRKRNRVLKNTLASLRELKVGV